MSQLKKIVSAIHKLPKFMQSTALSYSIGNAVKFAGTGGIRFEKMSSNEVVLSMDNKSKVQNHLKQIHAAATALLAETATGMIVAMNLPSDRIPLLKNMSIDYVKRSQGKQTAVATLDQEAIQHILAEEKGELLVPVVVKDSVGTEVIKAQMLWAWIPKKKR